LYFTQDGGQHWSALKAGLPTIAVRDLEIQRRESDLVVRELLANCNDALHVDASAILLQDAARTMSRIVANASLSSPALESLINHPTLTRWLAQIRTPIVLNNRNERVIHGLSLRGSEKLVVCPLLDANRVSLGTLVVIRKSAGRDYENSDRNLVAALADKAARVLAVTYDSLTGLLLRESFERAVGRALDEAHDQKRRSALLHINIDQLKLVNDTFGRDTGDGLLREVAEMLADHAEGSDVLARLGGDEFGLLLPDRSLDDAGERAETIVQKATRLTCGDQTRQLNVGISVGVVAVDGALDSVVEVMARADLACLEAKEQGRGRTVVYNSDDTAINARENQMHWVSRLQRALRDDSFELFAQTLRPSAGGLQAPHFELLLRMRGEGDKYLYPSVFLPVAERYHMMPDIDRWVIEHALATLDRHYDPSAHGEAVFAINLSGQSLTDRQLLDFLLEQLQQTGFPTERLCFEITETAIIRNLVAAQDFVRRVKQFGCQFALDDFGAGVSSFTNLRALDLDYLKIDGSFVADMLSDPVSAAMVSAINQVGQTMELKTVAEFESTAEIARAVADLGVTFQQG
ncbi:MAG: EAL domain-containing protein, partial [Pseudomonadota bacterium]